MKLKSIFIALFSLTIICCLANDQTKYSEITLLSEPPFSSSNKDGFWQTMNIANTGIEEKLLKKHILLCKETGADSQIVIYKNKIISEWYSDNYSIPVYAMSSTKAITSILIGMLVDSKKISSYNDILKKYVPEWNGGFRDHVTIENLLTHTSGLKQAFDKGKSVGFESDKTGFVLSLKPDWEPGTEFSYSNEGVQLLEPLIERTAGTKTGEYAKEALFKPLGMYDTQLNSDAMGHAWTYADMKTTPRDMARIGLLMCNNGYWNSKRIISNDYIKRAISPTKTNQGMGYLWWILYSRDRKRIGFYASGYLNTDIYIFPEKEIVIVRTQQPKNGFTGAPESGDYFKRAIKIFEELLKKT